MFDFNSDCKNKYYTLYKKLREEILKGKLKAGEKLPSKRKMAEELGVSVVTAELALSQLAAEGYIRSEERRGYFVEEVYSLNTPPRLVQKHVNKERKPEFKLDLVNGNIPAEMFPFSTWARLIRLVLADCGEHLLERVPCDGDGELKQAISDYLYRSRGIDAPPRYIVVGAGAEHLYGIIVQLLGRDKLFAVENPGYLKIASTYSLNGAKWVAVNVDGRGINIDSLISSGADVAHVSPSHQFPTGAVMPVSSRAKLISWANGRDGYIVEDDYDSEFRLVGKPLQSTYSLCPDRVIYINTFSKSLAPSMRLGYMVLPPALYERYINTFSESANLVPLFEQKALALMLNGGYFERHISRLRNYYKEVRKKLLNKLEGVCEVDDTGSGLHLVAKFPNLASDEVIKRKAAEEGVNIKCLSDYLLAPLEGVEKCAVINFTGYK
ncbi:MAG: PLP-dependent aminotransferase family protein [Clostridia bacterium]|nr:PLP-dependent aminotransferase family protein [Clostridia bacterium]